MDPGRENEKGQVLVLLPLILALLLAIAGFALDVGMAYVVKTKLSAAVDAAALAAGKVVAAQDGTTTVEAEKFFNANYPGGLLGATVELLPVKAAYDNKEKSWTVTASATASVPSYFAKAFNWDSFTVGASATTTISTVDLVLVLDASGSMGFPAETLPTLQRAAKRFVARFNTKNDRIGVIHFASGAEQDVTITSAAGFNRDQVEGAIDGIEKGGYTTAEEALRLAKQQLDDIPVDLRSRLRIIVFLADGAPNGVAANFSTASGNVVGALSSATSTPGVLHAVDKGDDFIGTYSGITTLPGIDWSNTVSMTSFNGMRSFNPPAVTDIQYTRCNLNMAARNMVENVANAARSESGPSVTPITLFAVGLGQHMKDLELGCPGYGSNEYGEVIMKRVANVKDADTYNPDQPTGIYVYSEDPTQIDAAFNQVAGAILRLSK